MSRTLVEIKRAQIEKERTMAETLAEQDAILKLKKLNGELLYTQNDLDEADEQWADKLNAREERWSEKVEAMDNHWAWRCFFFIAMTAIVTIILIKFL
jgi:hypothetical protein